MQPIWDKFKWAITHGAWFIGGIILLIDPKHIDEFAAAHPQWSGLILAGWTALVAWANKPKTSPLQMSMNQFYGSGGGGSPMPPPSSPPPKKAA